MAALPPNTEVLSMIGKSVSHYQIIEKLGEGGMGIVYKAEDTKLKRTVALKLLPPEMTRDKEAKKRFLHEAQAASSLEHNNICNIHEIDETDDGQTFIVMACYDGIPLKDKIHPRGEAAAPLTIDEAIDIAMQIAQGLRKAHDKGIVHRDIKPGNIFITEDGVVKIVDFGLAKLASLEKLTKTGTTVGTVSYMSPEQAGGKKVDHRTDIWSMGVVLYEMITGLLPFTGEYDQAVAYSILNEKQENVTALRTGVPLELERTINKMLEKKPDDRYQHADEILVDLRKLASRSKSTRRLMVTRRPSYKRPIVLATILGILLLCVIGAGFLFKWGILERAGISFIDKNSLAIMICENRENPSDTSRLGEMITDALITDLMESRYITVVSLQRLYDILKQMGIREQRRIEKWEQIEVAKRAGVDKILSPSIGKLGSRHVLTAQLIDVRTGNILRSLDVAGFQDDIHFMVDSLTRQIKMNIGLPQEALTEQDRPIADVTTHSQEAYRYFLEGEEHARWYNTLEAVTAFEKAVAIDSMFATAYSRLASEYRLLLKDQEAREAIDKAVEHISHTNERERYYIQFEKARSNGLKDEAKKFLWEWIEKYPDDKIAHFKLGYHYAREHRMYEEAINQYKRVLDLDPDFRDVYNRLGYAYAHLGMKKEAMEYMAKYVSLAPDKVNPYDSIGELYMNLMGDYDNAEKAFLKAYQMQPEFAIHKLAEVYRLKGQYRKAEELIQGTLHRAIMIPEGVKYFLLSHLLYERGDYPKALDMIQKAQVMEPSYGKSYWLAGLINLALNRMEEAEECLSSLTGAKFDSTYYYHLSGSIQLARGNTEPALAALEKPIHMTRGIYFSYFEHREFYRQSLAEACLNTNNLSRALEVCRDLIDENPNWARAYYLLGRIQEKQGMVKEAIDDYRTFLAKWPEADSDFPIIVKAREHIELLRDSR
jgi:serine/threonine protein kinase/tetratricopeptide (TPR) repeat protein